MWKIKIYVNKKLLSLSAMSYEVIRLTKENCKKSEKGIVVVSAHGSPGYTAFIVLQIVPEPTKSAFYH